MPPSRNYLFLLVSLHLTLCMQFSPEHLLPHACSLRTCYPLDEEESEIQLCGDLHLVIAKEVLDFSPHTWTQEQSKLTTICEGNWHTRYHQDYIAESQERLPESQLQLQRKLGCLKKARAVLLQDLEWIISEE
ncbi:hypothetical protein BDQ17DRAFT_1336071 [Cyathus striatus]|nr:hypothetical protein BDQ17DRAFT_1336071 [Cyathus striatus]